jgi:hypothetical protein
MAGTMLHGWAWLKKMATDFMILSTQKFSVSFTRTEVLEIHKYLHPGYFLWVATNPCMIQTSKELHIIISRSLSGHLPGSRLAQKANAVECNNGHCRRRPCALRHTVLLRQSHVIMS